jgi:hypothetical protein
MHAHKLGSRQHHWGQTSQAVGRHESVGTSPAGGGPTGGGAASEMQRGEHGDGARLPPSRTAAPGGSGKSDFLFMTRREEAGNEEEEYPGPE